MCRLVHGALVAVLTGLVCLPALAQSPGTPLVLPTKYDEHRFYVQPVTKDGSTLTLYTDTGGGLFVLREAADRLHLATENVGEEGKEPFYVTTLPELKPDASIPAPVSRGGRIPVFDPPEEMKKANPFEGDGMLGQAWFGGRVWTFDYPGKRLLLRAAGDVPKVDAAHRVPLGFKMDGSGGRALDFPRIQATIDGVTYDLLFDTGATTFLTDEALAALKDGRASARATSFITATTFETWRTAHPDWRVIEKAERTSGEAMIEVPKVTVGGYTVGPVWFTRRADKNFHQYMSQFMDEQVEGALGGSALHFFRITVDYPNAVAVFEK